MTRVRWIVAWHGNPRAGSIPSGREGLWRLLYPPDAVRAAIAVVRDKRADQPRGLQMQRHVRLIILGAGSAGLSAFKEASRLTDDILMVDPGPLGTTCARVGCMPSKALLQIARDVQTVRELAGNGMMTGGTGEADPRAILRRVRELRDHFASGPVDAVEEMGERYIRTSPRFVAPDTLELDGAPVSADAIIVATGTRPIVPEFWERLGARLLTSDTLFEQETLPGRVAVVGLGPIGAELGQALALLGVEVHVFARHDRVAGLGDPDVNRVALDALRRNLEIHVGPPVEPELVNDAVRMHCGEEIVTVDAVLAAIGRQPNVEGLNLEALGIGLNQQGLPALDPERLRAGSTPVHFAGDVKGITPLLHEAADDGRLAAYHAMNPDAECLARRTPLAIVFTEPEIARVGVGAEHLPENILIGSGDFTRQGRAVILGQNTGLLHVYADSSGRLVGGEMAVPGAEHLAHQLAWLIQWGVNVTDALLLPFYHPVLEEGLRTALQDIRRQLPERERRPDLPLCGDVDDPLPGL